MKKTAKAVALIIVGIFVISAVAIAQSPTPNPSPTGTYTVQPGDTGWDLARRYYDNPLIWQRIVDMNPSLQEPGRVIEKGDRIILRLKIGETLAGLERLGIDPPKAVPVEQMVGSHPTPPPTPQAKVEEASGIPWWGWIAIALCALLIIGIGLTLWMMQRGRWGQAARATEAQIARERELRRDPLNSGTPYVAGGIPVGDTARLTNFFDQQAARQFAERNPGIERPTPPRRMGPIESGFIQGEGLVGYLGQTPQPRRIEQPLAAYRARYSFADGTEGELMTLQGCMNPVAYGGDVYRGFTFTPRTNVVPTPEPERPAPAPVPHPAIAARRIREAAQEEGQTTITIGDQVLNFGRGVHLTVDHETGEIGMEGQAFSMTIQTKQARAERSTGTE